MVFPDRPLEAQDVLLGLLFVVLVLGVIRWLMRAVDFVFMLPVNILSQAVRLLYRFALWALLLPLRLLVFLLLLPAKLVALGDYLGVAGTVRLFVVAGLMGGASVFAACQPAFTEAVCRPGREWFAEMAANVDGVKPKIEAVCEPGKAWMKDLVENVGNINVGNVNLGDVVNFRGV